MKDVYSMSPINRTAAVVTSQRDTTDTLTLEQERENLLSHLNSIQAEMASMPLKSLARIKLGRDHQDIQNQIRTIKAKLNSHYKGDQLQGYILDIIREDYTDFRWNRLLNKAMKRLEESKTLLDNRIQGA